jgi:hypothetical protein
MLRKNCWQLTTKMGSPPTYFRLPDIVPGKEWPFLCPPHPLQARANTESLQWVKSFGIHDDRALQKFARYRCDVLVAWSYRHASAAHYRLCMDFMHVFWVIDDRTDKLPRNKVEKEVTDIKIALKWVCLFILVMSAQFHAETLMVRLQQMNRS